MSELIAVPLELKQANQFVSKLHRHHDPVHRDKFRIGCKLNGSLVGVVQLARPVARGLDDGETIEVVRLCTDGTPNACSFFMAERQGWQRIWATRELSLTFWKVKPEQA